MRTTTFLAAIFLASANACAGEIYKCMIDGKVRYTDAPCGKQEVNQVIKGGKPGKHVARKKTEPSDTILDIYGDKDDPDKVTGGIILSGDNFECDDPAYAKVEKVTSFTIVAQDGTKQLCRKKEVQQR